MGIRRLALLEDDPEVAHTMSALLDQESYQIKHYDAADKFIPDLSRLSFDLIIVDRHLGADDGLDVVRLLRENPSTTSVLVLVISGMKNEHDRIAGLEAGADDYLPKPFHTRELELRIKALFARASDRRSNSFVRRGDLSLDLQQDKFICADLDFELTGIETKIVKVLLAESPRVVSREELLTRVWEAEGEHLSPRTVDAHIRRLRDKLGPAAERLQTVRGFGYRL
ncbi:MAG: response regulator transcription factor [Verrucomicrobiales bacterium]